MPQTQTVLPGRSNDGLYGRAVRRLPSAVLVACLVAVTVGAVPAQAVVPGLNGKIAYVTSNWSDPQQLWVYDPVDETRTLLAGGQEDGHPMRASWSPDGKRLAFNMGAYGDPQIYVVGADGRGLTQLTTGSLQGAAPVWSPDSSQLAFIGGDQFSRALWVMDSTGASPRQLTPGDGYEEFNLGDSGRVSWSPDGRLLAFAGTGDGIYTVRPDGTNLTQLTSDYESDPAWSPDGQSIAYALFGEVRVMRSDGSDDRYLAEGLHPSWSPEGDMLLIRNAGGVRAVDVQSGETVGLVADDAGTADWQPTNLKRLAGRDRIGTSIAVSAASHPAGGASAVVLARADQYPDALAGVPLAHRVDGPLLLTGSHALDPRVNEELQDVLPRGRTVYILGGTSAISEDLVSQVRTLGYQAVRYGGVDRFDTARIVAEQGLPNASSVFLADGMAFQDPLIAGPAAGKAGGTLLLTAGGTLPEPTKAAMAKISGPRYAIGRNAATAAPSATAIVGADAAETSVKVAQRFVPDATHVAIASLRTFPDALSGGPHVTGLGGPILLTSPDQPSPSVTAYLRAAPAEYGYMYGGKAAVAEVVREALSDALR